MDLIIVHNENDETIHLPGAPTYCYSTLCGYCDVSCKEIKADAPTCKACLSLAKYFLSSRFTVEAKKALRRAVF